MGANTYLDTSYISLDLFWLIRIGLTVLVANRYFATEVVALTRFGNSPPMTHTHTHTNSSEIYTKSYQY